MRELSGLTALVTGASRGIGVYIARALAREKMQLALAARSAAELNALAAELSGQGVRAQAFVADVAAPESAAELVERVGASWDPSTSWSTTPASSSRRPSTRRRSRTWSA